MNTKECPTCGTNFQPHKRRRKYCSIPCQKGRGKTSIKRICVRDGCTEDFTVSYSTDPKKYCSRSCSAIETNRSSPKRSLEGECLSCGVSIPSSLKYCAYHKYGNNTHVAAPTSTNGLSVCAYCLSEFSPKSTTNVYCSSECYSDARKVRERERSRKRSAHNNINVANSRRNTKTRLVEYHGSRCVDCGLVAPPYLYEFDHRDPSTKLFSISTGDSTSYDALLEESLKCDLVCPNCHRVRTHLQRCPGCDFCLWSLHS